MLGITRTRQTNELGLYYDGSKIRGDMCRSLALRSFLWLFFYGELLFVSVTGNDKEVLNHPRNQQKGATLQQTQSIQYMYIQTPDSPSQPTRPPPRGSCMPFEHVVSVVHFRTVPLFVQTTTYYSSRAPGLCILCKDAYLVSLCRYPHRPTNRYSIY